ncbi:MAG: hypothetical protein HY909_04145 [Deltaproteobacteria bacterium]|nr:hypothetical protein [Deltaproteobacteria bacterium]
MRTRWRALALSLVVGCTNRNATPAADAGQPRATPADAGTAAATPPAGPVETPSGALLTVRGRALRKILNLIAPGPAGAVLGQFAPQFSPGIGEHGIEVDPDAAWAAVMMAPEGESPNPRLGLVVAWPLRAGAQVAADAQARRNFREVSPGVYEPSEAPRDAGAGEEQPCWVARRRPVGWMLLCGPRESLRASWAYALRQGSEAPADDVVADATVRPEPLRRILATQLANLQTGAGLRMPDGGAIPRAELEAARHGVQNSKQLMDDLAGLHATLTVDQEQYRIHAEGDFAHATGESSRALLGATVGRRAALDLLRTLPAGVQGWLAMGVDMRALSPLLAPTASDPQMLRVLGPEMVRLHEAAQGLIDFRRAGDRAVGIVTENGGSVIQVARMPNATDAVAQVRTAAAAVPRTPRASGAVPASYFQLLPVPGLPPGSLRIRMGQDPARLPPNVPAAVRQLMSRSVLFVPTGDRLTLLEAQDPAAQYRALQTGARLDPQLTGDPVAALHLTPASFASLIGAPADPEAPLSATDAIDGTLTAARSGDDGAHFVLDLRAPITAVGQLLGLVGRIQQAQAQAEVEQRRAQAAARAAQGPQGRRPGGPGRPGGPSLWGPSSPEQLPEPNFQLRPPPP